MPRVVQSALHDRHTIEPITTERRVPPQLGHASSDFGHSGSIDWHSGQMRICSLRTTPLAHDGSPLTGSVWIRPQRWQGMDQASRTGSARERVSGSRRAPAQSSAP